MSLSMFANVDEYRESLKVDDDKRAEQYSSPVAYAQGIRQKLGDSVQVKPVFNFKLGFIYRAGSVNQIANGPFIRVRHLI